MPDVSLTLLKSIRLPSAAASARELQALAAFTLGAEGVKGNVELTLELTGHERIQQLNRRFRGVDRTTDVISFRHDPGLPGPAPVLSGDIAINIQQAELQARRMRHALPREVRLLWIHGLLHLLGYTDYTPVPRRRMFKRQNALLRRWERRPRA